MGESVPNSRWRRTWEGQVVHSDSQQHVELVLRTLGVDEAAWTKTLDRYAARVNGSSSTEQRLAALSEAFRPVAAFATDLHDQPPAPCAACGKVAVAPVVGRSSGPGATLIYGACRACGHGQLLSGAAVAPYQGRSYYEQRSSDGSGYAEYAAERAYREAKGQKLLARLLDAAPARSLLEVGSGYGFTLQAARRLGLRVAGVDINPDAVRGAHTLYGLSTLHGTLRTALESGALGAGEWDLVLYQFVLEHIAEPRLELSLAARALSAVGRLVLIVPSMTCVELEVFGARYRSLRGDHLHLFSATSIARLLADADLTLVSLESHCNLHLLQGFLTPSELSALYGSGRGPDLTIVAQRNVR